MFSKRQKNRPFGRFASHKDRNGGPRKKGTAAQQRSYRWHFIIMWGTPQMSKTSEVVTNPSSL